MLRDDNDVACLKHDVLLQIAAARHIGVTEWQRLLLAVLGPAQSAVAKAVADSVSENVISKKQAEDYVIVCGVFIHPEASDDRKIYDYNYQATKDAIKNAMQSKPTVDEILAGKDKAAHPFRGF